jgi:hypothetical protein
VNAPPPGTLNVTATYRRSAAFSRPLRLGPGPRVKAFLALFNANRLGSWSLLMRHRSLNQASKDLEQPSAAVSGRAGPLHTNMLHFHSSSKSAQSRSRDLTHTKRCAFRARNESWRTACASPDSGPYRAAADYTPNVTLLIGVPAPWHEIAHQSAQVLVPFAAMDRKKLGLQRAGGFILRKFC